jgi:hypothetical protein
MGWKRQHDEGTNQKAVQRSQRDRSMMSSQCIDSCKDAQTFSTLSCKIPQPRGQGYTHIFAHPVEVDCPIEAERCSKMSTARI